MSQDPQYNPFTPPNAQSIPTPNRAAAAARVSAPAMGLIVTGMLGIVAQVILIGLNLLGIGLAAADAIPRDGGADPVGMMVGGSVQVFFGLLTIAIGGFVIWGALKMKALENYGVAMAASILAAVPCLSPGCFLGIPIGIWAVVVLVSDDVKRSFS